MPDPAEQQITADISPGFAEWMSSCGGSIAVTTYQANKVGFIGWNGRQVSLLMRHFPKPMGMASTGEALALATREHILLFAHAGSLVDDYNPAKPGAYDRLYLPRVTYHTGNIAAHDLHFTNSGLLLLNTRFSCLCTLGPKHSFSPTWKPPFIREISPEDHCHLNGIAMREDTPQFLTALGRTFEADGWRSNKATGGILIDYPAGETVIGGLCMPHSPRLHGGRLYFLNSGKGELCVADAARSTYEVITALSGYTRGLAFTGDFALVGTSTIRETSTFGGLPISEKLSTLRCGISVIDLRSGRSVGEITFLTGARELYEVLFLSGHLRPNIISPEMPAAGEAFALPDGGFWIRSVKNGSPK